MTTNQLAACNKLHEAEARLARWLLMVRDRMQDDYLPLTQEFLAEMLGTRRTTVALAGRSAAAGGNDSVLARSGEDTFGRRPCDRGVRMLQRCEAFI